MAAAGRRDDGPGGDATGGAGGGLRNALRGDLGCLELPGFPRISGEFKMVKREKIWKNWRFMVVFCGFLVFKILVGLGIWVDFH